MLLGVGVIEGKTPVLASGTNEFLPYTKSLLEQGEIPKESCGNLPTQSTQYQQGNGTTFRQQTHPGIGSFSASRPEIVFRAATKAFLAFRSVLAVSRSNRIRWTVNTSWFGVCGTSKPGH